MSRCKNCINSSELACGGYSCNVSRWQRAYAITWLHSMLCRKYKEQESNVNNKIDNNFSEVIPIVANNIPIGVVKRIDNGIIECILWEQFVGKSYMDMGNTISDIHITCKECNKKRYGDLFKKYGDDIQCATE